jgi:hypothetical protein
MCPACVATLALIAAGAGSAGGVTALVVSKLRGRRDRPTTDDPKTGTGTHGPEEKQR